MKQTKIVATIGPASGTYDQLKALVKAGVNVLRFNFSHGAYQWYKDLFVQVEKLRKELQEPIAIMLDTKGPEIRTAEVESPVEVSPGDEIIFTIEPGAYQDTGKLTVSYEAFIDDVREGEELFLDNGVMRAKIKKIKEKDVICEMLDGGSIGSRRRINIPGREVSLESITDKDWEDIDFGIAQGVDIIALSFVRNADSVCELRDYLKKKKSQVSIMAKIESFEATKHLASIVEASDSVMIARGDLGAEVPFAEVPLLQQQIIDYATDYQKPVLVATHMLESMIQNPIPTRAEVTDVAHAVYQEADSLMLSGETAAGEYPLKSVEAMAEIIRVNEGASGIQTLRDPVIESDREVFAKLAAMLPTDREEIGGIVVITESGWTARMVSSFRPGVPIFAFTPDKGAAQRLQIVWGVVPFVIPFDEDQPEKTVEVAQKLLFEKYPAYKGQKVVLVSDVLVDKNMTPVLQVRQW